MNPMNLLQNITANSPMGKVMQMVKVGQNPQVLLNQMIRQNPQT